MSLGLFKPTSEEVTAAFLIALAAVFLYLQLKRLARLSRQHPDEPKDQEPRDKDEAE